MNIWTNNHIFEYKNVEEIQMNEELCECTVIHEDAVNSVKENMPDDGLIYDLAEFFKVFAFFTETVSLSVFFLISASVFTASLFFASGSFWSGYLILEW